MPKRKHSSNEENENANPDSDKIQDSEEESGENLFGSDYMEDYQVRPDLDTYDISSDQSSIHEELLRELSNTQEPLVIHTDKTLKNKLIDFLNKRHKEIKKMCTTNQESFYASYLEIEKECEECIDALIKETELFMATFDDALEHVVKNLFPNYKYIKPKVHARIKDVPVEEEIRALRNVHLNTLVKVRGVITRRSGVFPLLSLVTFHCNKCGSSFGPLVHNSDIPKICVSCQSKGPHTINSSETVYKDLQKLTIQEVPGSIPSGRLPRQKEVYLYYDLIDYAKPGEIVEVTGIYKNIMNYAINYKKGIPVFSTVIEAITIEKKEEDVHITSDVKEIIKLSKHPQIKNILLNSIAPFIYGHKDVKKAVALALFGGQRKEHEGHSIRGDINVLLLGDPGTAKSQFLRYVESLSHRAVLATGQGASSVGLTASVRKDQLTKEWTLEGGALVLADKGVCLIDEFDKMDDIDRVSIHEAMEQQSISISKAGIIASLHARCSVIAAANPRKGRYNNNLTFAQNVNLSDPIISRFDILCIIRDVIGGDDKVMGDFIVNSHMKLSKDENEKEKITDYAGSNGLTKDEHGNDVMTQEMLKKYIIYARQHCFPMVREMDKEKISRLYSDLRRESMVAGSIPITARHIEGIIRMSEAFAKMKLRTYVTSDDIDSAIEVALESFMNAQKYSITKALRKKFGKYINPGNEAFIYVLNELVTEKLGAAGCEGITQKEFESRLQNVGLKIKKEFYTSNEFRANGYLLSNDMIVLQTNK